MIAGRSASESIFATRPAPSAERSDCAGGSGISESASEKTTSSG